MITTDKLEELLKTGVIRMSGDIPPHRIGRRKAFADVVYPFLEALFPDAWELWLGNNLTYITLYYPEVTVTDGSNRTHKVTDLYVRLHFNNQLSLTTTIEGTRGSLTYAEYSSRYVHSHLDSEAVNEFGAFCLGETHLNELVTILGMDGLIDDNNQLIEGADLLFEAILHQLGEFVSHEASEGMPHYLLSEIGTGSSRNAGVPDQYLEDSLENFKYYCKETNWIPETYLKDGIPTVDRNKASLEQALLQTCTLYQYRDVNGKFYDEDIAPSEDSINEDFETFTFRGKEITQKITTTPHNYEQRQEYAHRKIKDYIVEWLDSEAAKRVIARRESKLQSEYQELRSRERAAGGSSPRSRRREAHHKTARFFKGLVPIGQDTQQRMVGSDILQSE